MASWRDGAAYAPIERPEGFAAPTVAPLDQTDPYRPNTPGALAHPTTFALQQPAPALATIEPRRTVQRDPRTAFPLANTLLLTQAPQQHISRDPRMPLVVAAQRAEEVSTPAVPVAPPAGPPIGVAPLNIPPLPQPVLAPAQQTQAQTLALLAAAVSFAGLLLPPAAAITMLIAGAISIRSTTRTGNLHLIAFALGTTATLVQLMQGSLGEPNAVWSIACLCLGFAYFIAGLRPQQRR